MDELNQDGAAQVGEASAAPEQPDATPVAESVEEQAAPDFETPEPPAPALPPTLEERVAALERLPQKLHDAGIRLND